MCCKGLVKKVVPFFIALTVGLFITSLFVTVAAPSFSFGKRNWKKHREYHRTMEFENRELRRENFRLERKLAELEKRQQAVFELQELESDVPPPPLVPIAPARSR